MSTPMSTRRTSARAAPVAAAAAPIDAFNTVPHQQLVAATEGACAVFRGFEAMRKVQEQAAHQALTRHQRALDQLRDAHEPAQWMAIEAELLRFDVEGATQYWQQLGEAALQMHGDIMDCFAHLAGPDGRGPTPGALDMVPALATGFGQFLKGNARSEAS